MSARGGGPGSLQKTDGLWVAVGEGPGGRHFRGGVCSTHVQLQPHHPERTCFPRHARLGEGRGGDRRRSEKRVSRARHSQSSAGRRDPRCPAPPRGLRANCAPEGAARASVRARLWRHWVHASVCSFGIRSTHVFSGRKLRYGTPRGEHSSPIEGAHSARASGRGQISTEQHERPSASHQAALHRSPACVSVRGVSGGLRGFPAQRLQKPPGWEQPSGQKVLFCPREQPHECVPRDRGPGRLSKHCLVFIHVFAMETLDTARDNPADTSLTSRSRTTGPHAASEEGDSASRQPREELKAGPGPRFAALRPPGGGRGDPRGRLCVRSPLSRRSPLWHTRPPSTLTQPPLMKTTFREVLLFYSSN
ncbi:hypothetical protein HJG60_011083 [Phyllostomus discolor]|uniref:Uncharacterized protein n=1 Tax=Phyllostomus discolor TaxID=89673 RepID=A0A834A1T3_9CHIR|nr:hypothetical protein HJG60_011083 [Phyllostomus discolor]